MSDDPYRCTDCGVYWQPEAAKDELRPDPFDGAGLICCDRRACLDRQRLAHTLDELIGETK